jgi:hypothetical protein
MRFSLKFMLIAVCVLGAYCGIMARLFYESPEQFFTAFILSYTVGPFLLAIGTIVWLGLRLRPGSRRSIMIWGIVLLFVPILGYVVSSTVLPMRDPLHYLTNYRLIHNRLVGHENEPWAWNELTNRINRRALSKAEVEECMNDLIAYMKLTKPNGWNEPMPWQRPFLQAAIQANLISDELQYDLCDAFYGPTTVVKVLRAERNDTLLNVEHGGHWGIEESGVDIDLIWSVTKLMIDGTPVKVTNGNGMFDSLWQADPATKLEPGEHEVSVEVENAYIDHKKKPGTLSKFPPDKWPPTLKRWTTSASAKFTVPDFKAAGQQVSPQAN